MEEQKVDAKYGLEDVEVFDPEEESNPTKMIARYLENPNTLREQFGLSQAQALNVAGIITGAGAGLGRKYLTNMIGAELAGAVGGFLGGFLSKKMLGG